MKNKTTTILNILVGILAIYIIISTIQLHKELKAIDAEGDNELCKLGVRAQIEACRMGVIGAYADAKLEPDDNTITSYENCEIYIMKYSRCKE